MPKTAQRTTETSLTANKLAPKPCMHSDHGGELFHPPYAASSKLVRSHPRQHRISDKGDSTVVEGGTLLLASSKPWVASLGPLTVLKSPRDLAPPCQRQPPRQDGGPWVGCCVTGDRLTVSSPGLLSVRLRSVGAVARWPLMSAGTAHRWRVVS